MNRIVTYAKAAVVAIAVLSACTKEQMAEQGGTYPAGGGQRVITLSFDESTKMALNSTGFKPVFVDGDYIKVCNATRWEDCRVSVSGGVATVRTALDGQLDAVYPREAALTNSNGIITGIKVSSSQSGKFSEANICRATIAAHASSATFMNRTALLRFYVDASIGVKSITITGTGNIANDGDNPKQITVDPAADALIHTVTEAPDTRICYVSILPGSYTLSFSSETTGQGQGIVTKTMKAASTFAANGIYNAFIPYYITIGTQKWGYCNVGAFLPEEYGQYFGWGDLVGQTWTGSDWSVERFSWKRDPANEGNADYNVEAFNRQKATVCPGNVLALAYDAAHKFWGTDWRMPTGGTNAATSEFKVLSNNTKKKTTLHGVAGWEFKDGSGNMVFFPLAGIGDGTFSDGTCGALNLVGVQANYWASTLVSDYLYKAYYLHLSRTNSVSIGNYDRVRAGSIRPIYDEFSVEGELSDYEHEEFEEVPQDEPLTGVFTVSKGLDGVAGTEDDVKVKFSKGNLRYTIATSQWSFFEHQYDCGPANYADGHDKEISLFTWGKSFWSYVPDGAGYYEGFEDISGTTRDWGTGKWRTLTYDEWIYLLNSRSITDRSRGYAKAHLWNGSYGVIIFPDGYSTISSGNGIQTAWFEDFPTTTISESDWTQMENQGVVFLPAAGTREGDTIKYAKQSDGYLHAIYWTSSPYFDTLEYACYITIGDNRDSSPRYWNFPEGSATSKSTFRREGLSVRLVTDAAP